MSRAAAFALALVFAWSSAAKLATKPDMTRLGLPRWSASATAAAEGCLVVLLLVAPVAGGIAALALLAGFSTFLARRLNSGTGCGCFGGASATPVTTRDLVRNAVLLVLAGAAAFG